MEQIRKKLIEILEQAGTMRQYPGSMARILIENGVTIPVHCEKCIYYKPQNKSAHWNSKTLYCMRTAAIKTKPTDFCSYGDDGGNKE